MSNISFIKKPITDIKKCTEAVTEMGELKKSYLKGDLTHLSYQRKIKDNKIKFARSSLPLATTAVIAATLGCMEVYEGFQSGIDFSDVIVGQFGTVSEFFNNAFDGDGKPVIDSLNELDSKTVSEYCSYVVKGTGEFLKNIKEQYINTSYILGLASVYGAMNAIASGIDFLAGDSKNLHKLRDYDTENKKLNILRKHYHDPVFDSLNNEEMYSMMVSFNKTLHNYHIGKKTAVKKVIGFFDKIGSTLITPFRKVFNTSTNEKSQMINSVYDYIENDINFENPELTYKKYGLHKADFKIVASRDGGITKKDMMNYIFKTNNNAMINAYKMKLKDDTILAFSLKLEEIARSPEVTDEHVKDMVSFKSFISGYEKNKSHLKGLKLPNDLKEMSDIVQKFFKNTDHSLHLITKDPRHQDYTQFLERNAPHLVSRSEDGSRVEINNYSFLSYFEGEKERLVKSDLIQSKILEYEEAKLGASEVMNRQRYRKMEEKIATLEEEAIKYRHLFGKKSIESETPPEDLMPKELTKISSSYIDPSLSDDHSVESFVVNHMLNDEHKLLAGAGLKEKGLDPRDAERARLYADLADYDPSKESTRSISESRMDFKKNGKRYQAPK